MEDAPALGTPQEEQKSKKKRSGDTAPILTGRQVVIIGVLTAGALLTLSLTIANNNLLTNQQKQDLISPFKFP